MIPQPLDEAEASLVTHAKELPILELLKGASEDELRAFRVYEPRDEKHFTERRQSWRPRQEYLLGERLGHRPSPDELLADGHTQNLRFHAWYVLSYWSMVKPLSEKPVDQRPDLINRGRPEGGYWIPCPLSREERLLIADTSHIPLLEIIKGMTNIELAAFDGYRVGVDRDYYRIQSEWLDTQRYLLGIRINREPQEHELLSDLENSGNAQRYRAFYVLHNPGKVVSLTRRFRPGVAAAVTEAKACSV